MRRSARTDLSGLRSVMSVPTGSITKYTILLPEPLLRGSARSVLVTPDSSGNDKGVFARLAEVVEHADPPSRCECGLSWIDDYQSFLKGIKDPGQTDIRRPGQILQGQSD